MAIGGFRSASALMRGTERFRAKAERLSERMDEGISAGLQMVEVGGTAFLFAYLNARYAKAGNPDIQVMGMSVDLITGVGLHGLGFLTRSKYREHLHNVGDGALAAYLTRLGAEMGGQSRLNAQNASGGQLGAGQQGFSGFGQQQGVAAQR
jgi:hypothetical protein